MCALRVLDIGNGRNNFPGYADTANGLVSCHVVGDQSEERGQRLGATASLGPGKLPDSLGVATQTAAGYGEARTGSTLGEGGSGRDVSGWVGRGCSRSTDRQQGVDCGCSPGGRPRDRANSDAAHPRRLGPKPGSLRGRVGGARPRGPHRRLVGLCSVTEPRIRSQDQFSSGKQAIAFRAAAASPSGGVAAKALAAGYASGSGERRASGLLPGRVHLPVQPAQIAQSDRKSTRLNSSHLVISYA